MSVITYRAAIGAAAVAATLALGGCATEAYVDEHVAAVQTQVTANSARLDDHDRRLTDLDGRVNKAQAQADAAYNMAKGEFNAQEVNKTTLNFETGVFSLNDAQRAQLTELATTLKSENKNVFLEIEGFADSRGDTKANRLLSARRAYRVYAFLRTQGIALNRMAIAGHGEELELAPNDTAEGREQNRAVVITVVG
jgi:outer membrane protein OmpA-like peptidoglycan-associated protein